MNCLFRAAPSYIGDVEILQAAIPEMIPMPVRKSAVELAACRGEAEVRPSLFSGVYQFQPILKVLADLKRDDPKFAFPAARLVGLYRRLWDSNACPKKRSRASCLSWRS
jgi:hypothetical protein